MRPHFAWVPARCGLRPAGEAYFEQTLTLKRNPWRRSAVSITRAKPQDPSGCYPHNARKGEPMRHLAAAFGDDKRERKGEQQ